MKGVAGSTGLRVHRRHDASAGGRRGSAPPLSCREGELLSNGKGEGPCTHTQPDCTAAAAATAGLGSSRTHTHSHRQQQYTPEKGKTGK